VRSRRQAQQQFWLADVAAGNGDGTMLTLLMLAGGMGMASATATLWMQGRRMVHQRVFAALVSATVTVILFSLVAWATAVVMTSTPVSVIWLLTGMLALPFALRLYRELRSLPAIDNS
jgi:hypothetical protein